MRMDTKFMELCIQESNPEKAPDRFVPTSVHSFKPALAGGFNLRRFIHLSVCLAQFASIPCN